MAEYTDEQIEEIKAAARAETQTELEKALDGIEALKKVNADMKQEKINLKLEREEAIKQLEQESIDKLREAGKEAEAAKLEAERRAREVEEKAREAEEAKSKAELYLNKTIESKKEAATKSILSMFVDQDEDMEKIAAQYINTEFDDEKGEFITQFLDRSGNVVSDNVNDWRDNWASKDPAMQKRLSGSRASGVNSENFKPADPGYKPSSATLNYKANLQG